MEPAAREERGRGARRRPAGSAGTTAARARRPGGAPLRGPSAEPPARPRSPLARRARGPGAGGERRRGARATVSKLAAAPGTEAEREARGRGRSCGQGRGGRARPSGRRTRCGRCAGSTSGGPRAQPAPSTALRKGVPTPARRSSSPARFGGQRAPPGGALGEQRKGRACWFLETVASVVARLERSVKSAKRKEQFVPGG